MKAGGEIKPWDGSDDVISILDSEPQPGEIEHTRDYPYIKAKEYMLGNGMKVSLGSRLCATSHKSVLLFLHPRSRLSSHYLPAPLRLIEDMIEASPERYM